MSITSISHSTISQRSSIGLRYCDCGGHLSTVNSLSCLRNQFEIFKLCYMVQCAAGGSHQTLCTLSSFWCSVWNSAVRDCDWLTRHLCNQKCEQVSLRDYFSTQCALQNSKVIFQHCFVITLKFNITNELGFTNDV